MSNTAAVIRCENCNRIIGKLETPQIIGGAVVCVECLPRIAKNLAPQAGQPASAPQVKACPVCGSTAAPIKKAKGSTLLLIILLLLWILPGLIYLMFFNGYVWKCSKCGAKIADA